MGRAPIIADMAEPAWRHLEQSAEAPLQFGIRDLLIAQAVVAVCLGLFAVVGVFAAVVMFAATLVLCAVQADSIDSKAKRCITDLMGGIVLPALCIYYVAPPPEDDAIAVALIVIAFQMLTLLAWTVGGSRWGRCQAVFAGIFIVGVLLSGIIILPLFFFGLIGLLYYGLGLLCFVPILTCCIYVRNVGDALRQARTAQGRWSTRALLFLGVLLAVGVPALTFLAGGHWIEGKVAPKWPHDGFGLAFDHWLPQIFWYFY
jgi:hypothetical protein